MIHAPQSRVTASRILTTPTKGLRTACAFAYGVVAHSRRLCSLDYNTTPVKYRSLRPAVRGNPYPYFFLRRATSTGPRLSPLPYTLSSAQLWLMHASCRGKGILLLSTLLYYAWYA